MKKSPLLFKLLLFFIVTSLTFCSKDTPFVDDPIDTPPPIDNPPIDTPPPVLTPPVLTPPTYKVNSKEDFEKIMNDLMPGDTVIFAAKNWENKKFEFKGNGTEKDSIVFMAEEPGKTIFSGDSKISINGRYLIVKDFAFKNGNALTENHVIEFRSGRSLASNCRLTNVTFTDFNSSDLSLTYRWVSLFGKNNRVDHCSFSGKKNVGNVLTVWMNEVSDDHLIDHNYFGYRLPLGQNGAEIIRIGASTQQKYSSNTIIEFNLFEECDGETEIISDKSKGNTYRHNVFKNCAGMLTLRHASFSKVYGNYFFGDPAKRCAGIRIVGEGHEVFNNYLQDLSGTSTYAAISMTNSSLNEPEHGYQLVNNVSVGFNTIVNCREAFAIGIGASSTQNQPPFNSRIENNLVIVGKNNHSSGDNVLVNLYDANADIKWTGNFTNFSNTGLNHTGGFTIAELPMIETNNIYKIYRPDKTSPSIASSQFGYFNWLNIDIDGQSRPTSLKDVGCDQYSNEITRIKPVTRKDVGASYDL